MSVPTTYLPIPGTKETLRYQSMSWASEVYALPCYDLRCDADVTAPAVHHLNAWLSEQRTAGSCLVRATLPASAFQAYRALTRAGFRPVESMIEFSLSLDRFDASESEPDPRGRLRLCRRTDLQSFITPAGKAIAETGWFLDRRLPSRKPEVLAAGWMDQFFGDLNPIYVHELVPSAEVAGLICYREKSPTTIRISLAAARDNRDAVEMAMLRQSLLRCRARGYRFVKTSISTNRLNQINLALSLGFTLRNSACRLHWYHAVDSPKDLHRDR